MIQTRSIVTAVFVATIAAVGIGWAIDGRTSQIGSTLASTSIEDRSCTDRLHGKVYLRTELLFGLSRPVGPKVTEEEFQGFIDSEVTRRFPSGLTLFNGTGQFKESSGTIIQESSKLLILLYPFNEASHRAVDEIREEYRKVFQQESVLRVDEQSCVSF